MGCRKDLAEGEKSSCYKRNNQSQNTSERINRCVMTEIGGSVRIFGKILQSEKPRSDRGGLNLFSMHDMNRLKKT